MAYLNETFLESPDARGLRILSEYLEPLSHFRDEKIQDTIVFFGSARISEEGPLAEYYRDARTLARLITEWSSKIEAPFHRFVICSGGGPGIMEAANRGASDAGGKTIGLNIGLPFEQRPNPFITPGAVLRIPLLLHAQVLVRVSGQSSGDFPRRFRHHGRAFRNPDPGADARSWKARS